MPAANRAPGSRRSSGSRTRAAPANSSRDDALSREEIVESAIAWIDREGIDSFSMRRFAASLTISGPALYWHFRNREDLLGATAERLLERVDSRLRRNEPWEVAVRRMLNSVWNTAAKHPGLLDVLRTQTLRIGAGQRLLQSLLVTLRGAGFGPELAVDHTRALLWTTFGLIRGAASSAERVDGPRHARVMRTEMDLSALDPKTLPAIADSLPRLATLDIDALFQHTLDTMIAGLGQPPGHR
jgi:TetR/AcrR family tetracycline transcriptional repressor